MIVRSSVNACCTSRQKSSSSARSAGVRPSARGPRRRSCSRPSCFRDGMAAPAATSDSTKWRRVSIGSPSPSPERAAQQHSVGDQVDDYHQRSQHDLQRPRQSGRVQRREDVVLDEPAGVAFEAGAPAQGILERRERAHPALVLDHGPPDSAGEVRSEEHTSELQSLAYLVCRLLLEKKKQRKTVTSSDEASTKRPASSRPR